MKRDLEEKEDGEPLVLEVVTEANLAMEVREVGEADARGFWGRGEGESEGLVLPYVVGGEGREKLNDLKVEGLE